MLVWFAAVLGHPAQAQKPGADTEITLQTLGGLRFDPPRFVVEPGAKVKVNLENADDMAHNFVITKPDARMEVVNAAMTLQVTPDADFIPKTDKILQHSPVLLPGKKASLSFTAPTAEGVYPYVCTYPGHGIVMYGAMYVTSKPRDPLPPLAKDMNIPENVRTLGEAQVLHAYQEVPPYVCRIFVRDTGPASMAVALPGNQNYCWDAGACRLRYAWFGAFLDPMPHWTGNGDGLAEVLGRIYYRAPAGMQLRLGAGDQEPQVKFLGYRLVQRFPEFHYTVNGVEVRELIKPQHHGGLELTFTLTNPTEPVLYKIDPKGGAVFAASVGEFKEGVLALTAAQAKSFTITLTEVPGREPLRYWSMNDTPKGRRGALNETGVRGRAVPFDGAKQQLETGLTTDTIAKGGTMALWVRIPPTKGKPKKGATPPPPRPPQAIVGAMNGDNGFYLGWNLDDANGFELLSVAGSAQVKVAAASPADQAWHHLAVTYSGTEFTLYVDGQKAGTAAGALVADAPIFLGSAGGTKFAGVVLDEARIDDRAYTPAEIAALFERERPQNSAPAK